MAEKIIDEKIDITSGISGFFAVHMVHIEDSEIGEYWDCQNTGVGRYRSSQEAIKEAKMWSQMDNIPLASHLI